MTRRFLIAALLMIVPLTADAGLASIPVGNLRVVDPSVGGCSFDHDLGLSSFAYRGHTVYAYDCYSGYSTSQLDFAATFDTPVKCAPSDPTCLRVTGTATVAYLVVGTTKTVRLVNPTAWVTTGGQTYSLDLSSAKTFSSTGFDSLVRDFADYLLGRTLTFKPSAVVSGPGQGFTIDGRALLAGGSVPVVFSIVPSGNGQDFRGTLSLGCDGSCSPVRQNLRVFTLDGQWGDALNVRITATGSLLTEIGFPALSSLGYQYVDAAGVTGEHLYPPALNITHEDSWDAITGLDDWEEGLVGRLGADFVKFMVTHTIYLAVTQR